MTIITRIIRWMSFFAFLALIYNMDSVPTEDERFAMAFGFITGWIMSSVLTDV